MYSLFLYLKDIHRPFHQPKNKVDSFSSTHGTLSRTDRMLDHNSGTRLVLLQELRPLSRWRMITLGWGQACGPQTGWNQKANIRLRWWPFYYLTTSQSEKSYALCSATSPNVAYKNFPETHWGVQVFWARATHSSCMALVISLSLLQTLTFQFVWNEFQFDNTLTYKEAKTVVLVLLWGL